ncbi:MAG: phosphatidylserine decarboxylase [Gammaproteobacteria bacterium]|nr:phosphatidylserine decarboxylase [Gammaproteobacteria bacterium]
MYWVTRCEWPPLKDAMIRAAIRLYRVDMEQAVQTDPQDYPSFNAFFTRALKPAARPLATGDEVIACPVDGTVSETGTIDGSTIVQAKGVHYSLEALLGGDERLAMRFRNGSFATLYLSPRDYHRIHMPVNGRLECMIHIPGRLFSVSPSSTRTISGIFSRNERVVSLFETQAGPMAVIMVGAIFVASMDTVWAGTVAPRSRACSHWYYGKGASSVPSLDKGAEMGRFNMGSTVILLFPKDTITWDHELRPGVEVRMGEGIGTVDPR